MRDIVKTEGLNIQLNEIVDHYVDQEIDEMIETVEEWKKSSSMISADTVIQLLKSHKSKK